MSDDSQFRLEVVFATPERQCLIEINVSPGSTCEEAVRLSGIGREFPDDSVETLPIAVWGKAVARDKPVSDGDRIEILRPLVINPRDARRELSIDGQTMGGSGLRRSDS